MTTVRIVDQRGGHPGGGTGAVVLPLLSGAPNGTLGSGQGSGLAISKGFLAVMDGEIWVEDTPGGGATLAFSLASVEG